MQDSAQSKRLNTRLSTPVQQASYLRARFSNAIKELVEEKQGE